MALFALFTLLLAVAGLVLWYAFSPTLPQQPEIAARPGTNEGGYG